MGEGIAKFNMNLGISFPKLYMNLGDLEMLQTSVLLLDRVELILHVSYFTMQSYYIPLASARKVE